LSDAVKYRLNGKIGSLYEVKVNKTVKERLGKYKSEKPGDLVQVNNIHLLIRGKKRHFIAVDLFRQVAFSYEYLRLNSEKAKDFFKRLKEYCPFEINYLLYNLKLNKYKQNYQRTIC
jgi:hypothetical protein